MSNPLNQINDFNVNTPGLICIVTSGVENEISFIYEVDDFSPCTHTLHLEQIWTLDQEAIVRKAINWLSEKEKPTEKMLRELIKLQSILIDWLDSKEDLSIGVLND